MHALIPLSHMLFRNHAVGLRAGAGAALVALAAVCAAPAQADPAPNWNGWYHVTFHTDQ